MVARLSLLVSGIRSRDCTEPTKKNQDSLKFRR
jgi:hypothetical protein